MDNTHWDVGAVVLVVMAVHKVEPKWSPYTKINTQYMYTQP